MIWLDVITPVPETLIKDDERRKGVNRGILIAAALVLAFLFIFWLFGDLSGISDASAHPVLLVLLELAKVLGGFVVYLAACWGFKACVHIIRLLLKEKPAKPTVPEQKQEPTPAPAEVHVDIPPGMDLSEPDPIAVRDLFVPGIKQYVISNLYDWIVLEGNRTGAQLSYLYIALTKNHLIESVSPQKMLEALVNTYSDIKFVSESTLRHAYADVKNRPEGKDKKEDQAKTDAIIKVLTTPKSPK